MGDSFPKNRDDNNELNQLRAQVRLLSQAKDRQRELYLRTPAMLHSCGFQSRVVNVSDRWLEVMGYKRHEVLGRLETEFFSEESRRQYLETHSISIKHKGRLDDVPLTMVRKDGGLVHVLYSAVAEDASPGEHGGWLAVLRDITRQVEAEKALEETRKRLSGIFENSSLPMGMADLEGRWLEVNPALCALLGYSRREMMDLDNLGLTHPSDRENFARQVVRLIKGETGSLRLSLRYMHKGGDPVWVDMYVNPVRGQGGRVSSLVGAGVNITERKRTQEALAASEARFRELVESIREVFMVRDPYSGQLEYISPTAEEIFGYGRDYMYDNPLGLLDMVLPADRPVLEKALADQRVRGADTDVEYRIQRADGSVRWIRGRAVCVRGADGRVERVLGVAEDVTERKQAQLALAKSQEKFSLVFKNSPVWMTITTLDDGVFLDVNDAFTEVTGYTRGEVLGRTPKEVGLWTDGHRRHEAMRLLKEQGILRDFEIKYAPKGGEGRHALWSAEAFDLEGRECLISVIRDISRHRMTESALRQTSAALELAQKTARLGYWSVDPETMEAQWSEVMFEIMGQDPAKGVPSYDRHDQIIHPEDWVPFDKLVRRAVETGEPFDMEARVPWPDGTMHYIHGWGLSLQNHRGGPNQLFGITQDITERKRSEQARLAMEKQLRQARKLEAVGALSAGIAHDFNNLLAAILGNSELSLELLSDGVSCRENLEKIVDSTLRASRLVERMLAFSRAARNEPQPERLAPLMTGALSMLEVEIPAGVGIQRRLSRDLVAMVDAHQIEQVVVNLGRNALQAMEEDGGTLKVELDLVELSQDDAPSGLAQGPYARLRFSDTGQGMDPQVQERVFDPFFSTRGQGRGVGMGLAVVYGIVSSHAGAVLLESAPGQGSIFTVYLPAEPPSG